MHISTENNASGRISCAKSTARKKNKRTQHTIRHDSFLRICNLCICSFASLSPSLSSGKKIFFDKTENSMETSSAFRSERMKSACFFKRLHQNVPVVDVSFASALSLPLGSFRVCIEVFWYDNETLNPLSVRYCLRIKYDYIQTDL